MTLYNFIFSEKKSVRLLRHTCFWCAYCINSFYASLYPGNSINQLADWNLYYNSFVSFIFFLPGLTIIVYVSLYILLPRFVFKKKYGVFILAVACLLILNLYCDYFLARLTANLLNTSAQGETIFLNIWARAFIKGFQNSIIIISVAISIKLAKYWYLKQQENNKLTALKIHNEKQVLKANIRPDFLLYSLDNLRKKITVSYKDSAEMILHLSEVFSYILYDCSEELISLEKEIDAVENLIAVETIIHNNQMEIDITTNISDANKLIPPLLIFSFLQKIFSETEIKDKKINKVSVYIYTLQGELCVTCKLNYFDKIVIDFIHMEKMNENEKKLYALFNKFEIIRNEHENNYIINLTTFLYEPEKIKV